MFRTALPPPDPVGRSVTKPGWALYFCDSTLFLRHRAPQMTSPGTLLATSVCATDRQGWSQQRGAISHRQPVGLVLGQFDFQPLYTCPNFLRLAYVQSPRTSIIFPCTRSFICRSGLLWGTVTQDPTLSFANGPIRTPRPFPVP